MKSLLLASATFFALSLLSAKLFAESSHQFSLNVSGTKLHYESEGEAKAFSLGGTAYIEPVKKSSELPYARTAFYSRTGGLSLSANKEKHKDLNRIDFGQVLNSIEGKSYSAGLFIAHRNMPIWSQLNSIYLDEITYSYSSGEEIEADTDFIHSIAIGAFIAENLSIHGSYSKQELSTHGVGISKLFNMQKYGFFETSIQYSLTEGNEDDNDIIIVNNVVRNIGSYVSSSRNSSVRFSYFPLPQTELSLSYRKRDYDYGVKDKFYSLTIGHYFNDYIKVALNHTLKDATNFDNVGDYRATTLALGFDF